MILARIDCYKSLFGIEIGEKRQEEIQGEALIINSLIKELKGKKFEYVNGLFTKYQDPEKKPLIIEKIKLLARRVFGSEDEELLKSATEAAIKPFNFISLIESIPAGDERSKDQSTSILRMCRSRQSFETFNEESPGVIEEVLKLGDEFITKFSTLQVGIGVVSKKDFDDSMKKFEYSLDAINSEYLTYAPHKLQRFTLNKFAERYKEKTNSTSSSNQTNQFDLGSIKTSSFTSSSTKDKTERKKCQESNKILRISENKERILARIDCYKSLFGIEIGEKRQEEIQGETLKINGLIDKIEGKEFEYVKDLVTKYQDPEKKLLITEKINLFTKRVNELSNDTFLASANFASKKKPFNFICFIESIPAGSNSEKANHVFRLCQARESFQSFNEESPSIIQELLESKSLFNQFCIAQKEKGMISRKDFNDSFYSKNKMGSSSSSTSNSKTQESIFDNNQVNEASSSSNQTNQFNFGSTEQSPLISSSSNKTKELVGDSSKTSSSSESRNPSTSPKKAETILDPFEKIFDRLSGRRKSGGRKT